MAHFTVFLASRYSCELKKKGKEEGKDQESIKSSTTPDPGHLMGK